MFWTQTLTSLPPSSGRIYVIFTLHIKLSFVEPWATFADELHATVCVIHDKSGNFNTAK